MKNLIFFIIFQIINAQNYEIDTIKISWIDNGDNSTRITMTNTMDGATSWFAFGLSCDQSMGDDDVAICQVNKQANNVSLNHYYNLPHVPPQLMLNENPTIGYSNIETSFANGTATCSFTRQNQMSNVNHYFDLNKQFYILAAYGPTSLNDKIMRHSFHMPSFVKYGFQKVFIREKKLFFF